MSDSQDILNPPVINAYEERDSSVTSRAQVEQALQDKQAAEAAAVDPAPQAQEEEKPKENDQFAAKFAALTREEKKIRDERAAYMAEKKAWEESRQTQDEELGSLKNLKERMRTEPLKVMEENGLTFEELTEMMLNEGNPTPEMQIQRLKEQVEGGYKQEIEELKKQIASNEEKRNEEKYNETVENFKYELSEYISQNEETYELIKAQGAEDLVFDVIDQHYQETQRILTNEEAAKAVEAHLEEEARKLFSSVKKLAPNPPSGDEGSKPSGEAQPSVTLSNTQAAQVPNKGDRRLSNEESLKEAAKLLRWED